MQSLKGKTALITGAGKGIGKAIALGLAAEGMNIGLIGRTLVDLETVSQEIKSANPATKISFAVADISDHGAVKEAVQAIGKDLEVIDVLINNAGILKMGGILELSVEDWESVFKINVFGTYYVTREVLPYILKQGKGDIINIASTSGLRGANKMSAYGASKAAVINFTESLTQEVRKSNIRVTNVNPSTIATEMTLTANFTDGNVDKVLQPEDLAHLIVHHLKLPPRAFVKEIALWSTNP